MAFPALFEALKFHLKARGLTYADIARELAVSEATIKRIFSTRDCSMARLAELCEVAQVDLGELARSAPRQTRLLRQLSWAQEEALIADQRLFLVAVCALNQMSVAEIVADYQIEMPECIAHLMQLERLEILTLHPNNHIRLNVARTFAWLPDGPIMRHMAAMTADYFDHAFTAPGEFMRIINVRLSATSAAAMLARLELLAREYAEQHTADATLPLSARPALSLCLAIRQWQPPYFRALQRQTASDGK